MGQSVRDLVRARFGANASPVVNRALASIGITAARLFTNDPDRIAALVVNLSVNTLWVGHFPDVSATKGIRLNPSGGLVSLSAEEDYDLVGWEWFVIADAAGSNILTVEWLLSP